MGCHVVFFFFLRRQNVIAEVRSCLGFTPLPYGKCPRSSCSAPLWWQGSEACPHWRRLCRCPAPRPRAAQGQGMLIPQHCGGSSDSLEQEERPPGLAASLGDVSGSSQILVSRVNSCLLVLPLPSWDPAIRQWEGAGHPLCWCAQICAWTRMHSKGTLQDCPIRSPAPASLPKSLLSLSRGFAAHSVTLKRGSVLCSLALCYPCAMQGPRSVCLQARRAQCPAYPSPHSWGTRV